MRVSGGSKPHPWRERDRSPSFALPEETRGHVPRLLEGYQRCGRLIPITAVAWDVMRQNLGRWSDGRLLDHAEAQVRDILAFDDMQPFKLNRLNLEVLEQPCAVAEQHRRQIDVDLVQQPGL